MKILDERKEKWRGNTQFFLYEFDGSTHKYYPDFFIEEKGYFEVKGFKTLKDEAKWSFFPHQLTIIYGNDLIEIEKGAEIGRAH